MSGVETRFYHQAAATAKPHLNRSAELRRCRPLRLDRRRHLYRYELGRLRFAQPFLPSEKLPALQAPVTTKRRYTLTAQILLGNQPTPLRPRFRLPLSHPSSLQHRWDLNKMRFRWRSLAIDNNVSAREMERVVLNRKNSLFVGNP